MAITLLYFSILRMRTGLSRESLEIAGPISVGQLRRLLAERHPTLGQALPSAVAAINRNFASDDAMIADGDEVALFPPVSGGAPPGPTVFRITSDPIEMNDLLAELTL